MTTTGTSLTMALTSFRTSRERYDSQGATTSALPSSGAYASHPYRMSAVQDAAKPAATTTSRVRTGVLSPILTTSTAFAHMDNTGGVGESPTPIQRSPLQPSPQIGPTNRLSLANLLTFGGSTRKSRSDSVHRPSGGKRSRNGTPTPDPLQSNRATAIEPVPHPPPSNSLALNVGPSTATRRQRSKTLVAPVQSSSSRNLFTNPEHRDGPLPQHPYAYAHSPPPPGVPRRAPPILPQPPPAYSTTFDKGKGVDHSYQYPQPPSTDTLNVAEVPSHLRPTSRTSLLKTISAPNLRNLSRGIQTRKRPPSRGKSRWLCPETWCDALLFPRPRFMAHIDGEEPSPPGHRDEPCKAHTVGHAPKGRPSLGRSLLRASRSAVNLRVYTDFSPGPPRAEPMLMAHRKGSDEGDGWFPSGRPRSFAQDDLAIPSPVPSIGRCVRTIDVWCPPFSMIPFLGCSKWAHLLNGNAPFGGHKLNARFSPN